VRYLHGVSIREWTSGGTPSPRRAEAGRSEDDGEGGGRESGVVVAA
jgi:hypothetical protein